jgi:sulfur carrier protein
MPEPDSVITIQLNGEPYTLQGDQGLVSLLEGLRMRTGRLAVEINHTVVPRADYARTVLNDGDQVEIINFVGGG